QSMSSNEDDPSREHTGQPDAKRVKWTDEGEDATVKEEEEADEADPPPQQQIAAAAEVPRLQDVAAAAVPQQQAATIIRQINLVWQQSRIVNYLRQLMQPDNFAEFVRAVYPGVQFQIMQHRIAHSDSDDSE
ncbi:hypothetical protein PENTCL1PPCAC_10200, partial [Pristionchus entomophagus]